MALLIDTSVMVLVVLLNGTSVVVLLCGTALSCFSVVLLTGGISQWYTSMVPLLWYVSIVPLSRT